MNKLMKMLGIKPRQDQFMEMITGVLERHDFTILRAVSKNGYANSDDTVIEIDWLDDDAFFEIKLSFCYAPGKGLVVVLRNYTHHSIILNHSICGEFHTMEFTIPTESFLLSEYRARLDLVAKTVLANTKSVEFYQ